MSSHNIQCQLIAIQNTRNYVPRVSFCVEIEAWEINFGKISG